MDHNHLAFHNENRPILIKCVGLALAILCFGAFYEPSTPAFQLSNDHQPLLRNLDSDESESSASANTNAPYIAAACANVDYANSTYLNEVDPYALPLNELMIYLDHPYYIDPPNPNGPVLVDIGIYIHSIFNLDPGYNTFEMEGFLDLIWCDPHTKFDATLEGKSRKVFLERDADHELEDIRWPAIDFKNERNKRVTENQELIISSDGTVEYREKFMVTLMSPFDMSKFPFDEQFLRAEIESFAWNADQMKFSVDEGVVGFSPDFQIPEQTIVGVSEYLETVMEPRDRHPFSELVTEIHVFRNPIYYITKVFIPLGLIVSISWAVFWMDPHALADRMAISFTGVLTSAAYQFVVSEILPRHVTNTFIANFVLVSFVMMILTAVQNVAVRTLCYKGHPLAAKLMDRVSRVIVPLFFLVVSAVMATAQVLDDRYMTFGGVLAVSVALPMLLLLLTWYLVRRFKIKHPEYGITKSTEMETFLNQHSSRQLESGEGHPAVTNVETSERDDIGNLPSFSNTPNPPVRSSSRASDNSMQTL